MHAHRTFKFFLNKKNLLGVICDSLKILFKIDGGKDVRSIDSIFVNRHKRILFQKLGVMGVINLEFRQILIHQENTPAKREKKKTLRIFPISGRRNVD